MQSDHAGLPTIPKVIGRPTAASESILVIGHSGFVGRHVVRELQNASPNTRVISASTPEYDLTADSCVESLTPVLRSVGTVLFLAGVKRQFGDSLETFQANVVMMTNFCRCLKQQSVRRLIFVSSAAVYGEERTNLEITETTPACPTSLYGIAKWTSEMLLMQTLRHHPTTSLTIVRPPLIYGPGDTSVSYGPNGFARAATHGETITLWGDGSELREFLYVQDAARLLAALAFTEIDGIVNLASGTSRSYADILSEISRVTGKAVPTCSRSRTKEKADHRFSNTRLLSLLPDFTFTDLQDGVRLTLKDCQAAS